MHTILDRWTRLVDRWTQNSQTRTAGDRRERAHHHLGCPPVTPETQRSADRWTRLVDIWTRLVDRWTQNSQTLLHFFFIDLQPLKSDELLTKPKPERQEIEESVHTIIWAATRSGAPEFFSLRSCRAKRGHLKKF